MIITATGIGIRTPGIDDWPDFKSKLQQQFSGDMDTWLAPKPEAISARERRRAGLAINLGMEVTYQAARMDLSGATALDDIVTVFSSAMGDTDITDYMCRKLSGTEKMLSPTKFHNSVHNAPSGYWTISAENRQPSSFAGAFGDSFAGALLETASLALCEQKRAAMVVYDVANHAPFHDICKITEPLGMALLIHPGRQSVGWPMDISIQQGRGDASRADSEWLRERTAANPAGQGLSLLEAMARAQVRELRWPLGRDTHLRVTLSAPEAG